MCIRDRIIIIPNNSLANQDIVNLTKPDRYYRLRILVGVSYDSDAREVEETLIDVAKQNKDVEHDDPTRLPLVRFQAFGDSTLNFALVVWIKNVIKIRQINSDLHHEVFTKLREREIVIAFPQRDVHLYESSKPSKKVTKKIENSDSGKKAREEAEGKAKEAEEELKKAEESARKAEEERARLEAEEATRQFEEAAKEAEEAAKKAEEEKSKKAEAEAKKAEEAAKKAEEAAAKKEAEEQARIQAEWDAKEAAKKEAEEQARIQAEKEAEEAKEAAKLEEEEREKKEAEEAIRLEEEEKAKKEAEEAERIAKEKKAKLEAEEAETRKLIEEIKARQESAKKN